MKKHLLLKPLLLCVVICVTIASQAQNSTVVVSDCNLNGWQTLTEPTGSVAFVNGPTKPPLGNGSIQYSLGTDGNGKALIGTDQYAGTPLASLTELSYWTYIQQTFNGQAPAIEIYLDNNNDLQPDDRIVFEPIYQTGSTFGPPQNGGMVLTNTWQQWNALIGGWWTAHDGTAGPPTQTISSYLSLHPTATIVFLILTTGGGNTWNNFLGNADALKIGVNGSTTTYNFEPCEPENIKLVTICHKGKTITVGASAVPAHVAHGDVVGSCESTRQVKNESAAIGALSELRIPTVYSLSNYPNPFTNTTRINYSLPYNSTVSLKVFDLSGRVVANLFNGARNAGSYSIDFSGAHLGKGMYYYVLQANSEKGIFSQTKTMVLMK